MNERVLAESILGGQEASAANADEELYTRLVELNDSTLPIELRLEPRQNAALFDCYLGITDQHPILKSHAEQKAHMLGMAYAFTLGHDYALQYGRLGPEPEVKP